MSVKEKNIYLTIDVECHDLHRRNQYIDGLYDGGDCGLKYILDTAKLMGIPVNCFLDFPEAKQYGDEYIKTIVDLIKSYGQEIYLHLHPDYISGDHNRSYMWQYSKDEKRNILKEGFALYKRFMGEDALFYRVGRYGADLEMYEVMKELKIDVWDLSYCSNCPKMCHVPTEKVKYNNTSFIFNGQKILPNTRYVGLNLPFKKFFINFDSSDTTFDEFKRIIDSNTSNQLVLTMHSWNFIRKYFFLDNYVTLDKSQAEKFKLMVNYAKSKGYNFCSLKEHPPAVEKTKCDDIINPYNKIYLFPMMIFNNFVRFQKIGYLNRKYFFIYLTFYFFACLFIYKFFF